MKITVPGARIAPSGRGFWAGIEDFLNKTAVADGVVGDPTEGPDSALYEAMGYTRKSELKSGLTRKRKPPQTPTT